MIRVWETARMLFWRLLSEDRTVFEAAAERVGNQWICSLFDEWVREERGGLFVGTLDGEIVASVHLTFVRPHEAWSEAGHIGPQWQGRGLANDLKRFAIHQARLCGARRLGSWTESPRAARVMENCGFVRRGSWLKGGKLPPCAPVEPASVRTVGREELRDVLEFIQRHPVYQVTSGWIPMPHNHLAFHTLGYDDMEAVCQQGLLHAYDRNGELEGVGLASRVPHWETGVLQLVILQVYAAESAYLPIVTSLLAESGESKGPNLFTIYPGDEVLGQLDAYLRKASGTPRWTTPNLYTLELERG